MHEQFEAKIETLKRNYNGLLKHAHSNDSSLYHSYVSTSGYIIINRIVYYFLIRKVPAFLIRIQSSLFVPTDRYITSFKAMWNSMEANFCCEAIPELYNIDNSNYLTNSNNIDFGDIHQDTDEVALPQYSHQSISDFTAKMKSFLESDRVSCQLPSWIDLIFGCLQNYNYPKEMIEEYYSDKVKIGLSETDITFIRYFGQIPCLLFNEPHPYQLVNSNCYEELQTLLTTKQMNYQAETEGKTVESKTIEEHINKQINRIKTNMSSIHEKYRSAIKLLWSKNDSLKKEFSEIERKRDLYYKSLIVHKEEEHKKDLKRSTSKNYGAQQAKEMESKMVKYKIEEKSQLTLMETLVDANSKLKKRNSILEKQLRLIKEYSPSHK